MLTLCAASGAAAAPAVTVKAETILWRFADEKGENVREVNVQQVILESEYVRRIRGHDC